MNATLHIKTCLRIGGTELEETYGTPPFKVVDITENRRAKTRRVMIMNASPGVLDGDHYNIRVFLADQTALRLETQSYQRLFSMEHGATQNMEVHLGADSQFCYLPHPTVPHKSSNFTTNNKIYLHDKSSIIWSEVLTAGRLLQDGLFQFTRYQSNTEVFKGSKLVVKDNLLLMPQFFQVQTMGSLEGFTHQASLFWVAGQNSLETAEASLINFMEQQENETWGVSRLPIPGLLVRMLGLKAEPLYRCIQQMAALLQPSLFNQAAYAF